MHPELTDFTCCTFVVYTDFGIEPLFYAFFGGFDPGEGFFYCIKISRNIENEVQQYNAIIRENAEEFVILNW